MERRTIGQVLADHAATRGDVPFLKVDQQPWLTYAQLHAQAGRVAAGLQGRGVRHGDRVAVLCANRREAVEILFACARIGAIMVPLNYHLRGEFLRFQLEDCAPRVLVGDDAGLAMVSEAVGSELGATTIALDAVGVEQGALHFGELTAGREHPEDVEVSLGDTLSILYTSGTTGLPKGCMLSHGYMEAAGRSSRSVQWVVPGDRMMTAFPHFHASFHMNVLMSALLNDASLVYETEFHASTFMARAREEGATMVWGLGPMATAILARTTPEHGRVESLRMSAWVPLHPEQQAAFSERFGGLVSSEAYGQTEANPIVTTDPTDPDRLPESAGKASELYELAVVGPTDELLPPGTVGEIVVRPRGPHMMFSGYWNRPDATAATMRNLWHHTGDLGRLDDRGRLFFVDRMKDSVRRRGENVSCFELEMAIAQHPGVVTVAITAVPSPLGEDDIKATIVTAGGEALPLAAMFDYFRRSLPYFAIPRYVEFRAALPLTATGRVRKDDLRAEGIHDGLTDLEAEGLVVERSERRSVGATRD